MKAVLITKAALLVMTPLAESVHQKPFGATFAKSLLNGEAVAHRSGHRRVLSENSPTFLNNHRRFSSVPDRTKSHSSNSVPSCDASFLDCASDDACVTCFLSLETQGVDWASVTPDTPCSDVTKILLDAGHCGEMKGKQQSIDTFCKTFDNCVIWDEKDDGADNDAVALDCDALTECKWDGMYEGFVGDGICHDGIDCYNHAICKFDGGDCCEDTCSPATESFFVECGMEGYRCRDPQSEHCDPNLTSKCEKKDDTPKPKPFECPPDQTPYRLEMYDSFGDGWDDTKLYVTSNSNGNNIVFKGGLEDGNHGTEYICLANTPECYHVKVSGGIWGNEVSWDISPYQKGSPAVADGGSPMECEFSVAGEVCMRTCDGKPNKQIDDDPDYKAYKKLVSCMEEKCVIQMSTCKDDKSCAPCLSDSAPEYCYANGNFNALVDCGLCRCANGDDMSDYCQEKAAPGVVIPPDMYDDDDEIYERPCTAAETMKGSTAVLAFAKCSNLEEIGMMVTEFDQSNFGALDAFESCAHSFKSESMHGGKKALGCMQILANAIENPTDGIENPNAPAEAIKALAEAIYHNAESFCDCAQNASRDCPLCPSFMHMKTLLYESLDACQALDEIDCDAWNEFYTPCKNNLIGMYQSVDFSKKIQCDYAQNGCGGAGAFPAFRKLDCAKEIPQEAWDFYTMYEHSCIKGDSVPSTTPPPSGATPSTEAPGPTPATQSPAMPSDSATPRATPKPYVPSGGGSSKPYKPNGKKKGHFLRNMIIVLALAGGAYWYYKRQTGAFDFVHYRRPRNFAGDTEMYSSLAMDDAGSGTFEPPSLPPTPMNVETSMT